MHTLVIRNMVCDRCNKAVQRLLEAHGIPARHIELGEVLLADEPSAHQLQALAQALMQEGFELVADQEAATIARIKAAVVKFVHHSDSAPQVAKLSDHLAHSLNKEYSGLSTLFSQVEGMTIEHYFLLQRLERVKEMIKYNELTLSEIAYITGFSNVAHLSGQFKKLTGMTPTAFKAMRQGRTPLDQVGR